MFRGVHVCFLLSRGYSTKHVIEGLEPRTLYKFRLKVTSPSGEYEYSPVVSVATTSEYKLMLYVHRLEIKIDCGLRGLPGSREDSICKLYDNFVYCLGLDRMPSGRPAMLSKMGRAGLVPGLSSSWAFGTRWQLPF